MIPNLTQEAISRIFGSARDKGLVREEDTSLIFQDLDLLCKRTDLLRSVFPAGTLHAIAMKANPLVRILEILNDNELGVEVASFGELGIALKTGYPPEKIVFDSPAKTLQEIAFALEAGVHINIDSLTELDRVAQLKKTIRSKSTVGIRINPQVGIGSIAESSVAGEYSKFGIPFKTKKDELTAAFDKYEWLNGVHLHVGSQGCPMEMLIRGIGVLYEFALSVNRKHGMDRIRLFDIGGGLPISYHQDKTPVSMAAYAAAIREHFPLLFSDHFSLITEFGRWAHVNAGWTVSRVEYVKKDPGINTLMLHAGADLFLRECLLPGTWPHEYSVMDPDGKLRSGKDPVPYNLAGPLCFSGDIIAKSVTLPRVEEGDLLAIHDTGGYTLSMWSRYNSRQIPRVIGYRQEGSFFEILRERETVEELYNFWK